MKENVMKFACRFLAVTALLLSLLAVKPAAAQTAGVILGQVKDPSGAAIPNATVTLTSVETGASRTATSGEDGAYRFNAVEPGHYNVKVEVAGLQDLDHHWPDAGRGAGTCCRMSRWKSVPRPRK